MKLQVVLSVFRVETCIPDFPSATYPTIANITSKSGGMKCSVEQQIDNFFLSENLLIFQVVLP